MKRNYGLNCFRSLEEESFSYASSKGLSCIEIHLDKTHITLESFTNSKIDQILFLANKHGISLNFHNPYTINASDIILPFRENDTKYIMQSIKLAKELNITHITAHIGSFYWFPVEKWMRKKAMVRFVKSMDRIVELCDKYSIPFALENVVPLPHGTEYYYLGDNIEDFHYLFEKLDSKYFLFCLDTGHANVGDGVLEYIRNFGYKLKTLHFHDNLGSNDDHFPIGEGNIDWKSVAAALKNINYSGPFISECRKMEPHEAANEFEKYFEMS